VRAGPLVLNSLVARAICKLLLDAGFGPPNSSPLGLGRILI
jgi:hypothetical protein